LKQAESSQKQNGNLLKIFIANFSVFSNFMPLNAIVVCQKKKKKKRTILIIGKFISTSLQMGFLCFVFYGILFGISDDRVKFIVNRDLINPKVDDSFSCSGLFSKLIR
jgi:hypothetical protein